MAAKRIVFDPTRLAFARWQYEYTDTPVSVIAETLGCAKSTLYLRIHEEGWQRRLERAPRLALPPATLPAAAPLHGSAVDAPAPAISAPCDLAAIAAKLGDMIEGEIALLRASQNARASDGGQSERVARTAASLARTLRDLQAMRTLSPPALAPAAGAEADDLPTDLDELRHALAARIEALVERDRLNGGDADCMWSDTG